VETEGWRIPFGESGVLGFFQWVIPTAKEPNLRLNALKIVGNACAEKGMLFTVVPWRGMGVDKEVDANRKRVIEHPLGIEPLVDALVDPERRLIASVVLLNIINDYGSPARQISTYPRHC